MKAHPTLTRKGNVCLIITSVDQLKGTAIAEVTDRSVSTNPGLIDRMYSVNSLVTVMTVRFPIEGSFDRIQHHQVKNIAELEVGDKINAFIFHDEALKEIIIVSVAEERFLRNELERFGSGSDQKKPQPKNRDQMPVKNGATTGNGDENVASGYDLGQAFKQSGAYKTDSVDDDGPVRADVIRTYEIPDIREGRGHYRPAPRRHQRPHEQNRAA